MRKTSLRRMRKTILACSLGVGVIFAACQKQNVVSQTAETEQTGSIAPADPTEQFPNTARLTGDNNIYLLNGVTEIDLEDFTESDSTQYVGMDTTTVYVFEGETILLNWAASNAADPPALQNAKTYIRDGMSEINLFLDSATVLNILSDDEAMTTLFEGMYPGQLNARTKATGFFYKDPNYSNGTLGSSFHWPGLPSGWNNTISSFIAGPLALCDDTWFRSTKMWWVPGGGWRGNSPIPWFMNNRTTSIW